MSIQTRFGEKLRELRVSKIHPNFNRPLSRKMLADELRVKMNTVDAWENGRQFPGRLELLAGLEKALGFDVCAMLREAIDEEERGDIA